MRIAYLSTDFGVAINGSSGSSVHVREVTRALRALGHDARIYSTSRYEFDRSTEDGAVQIVHLEGYAQKAAQAIEHEDLGEYEHVRREFRRLLYSEYLQQALQPTLSQFDPHFVYERYSLFSYAGVQLARALGVPLILEVNSPLSREAAKHRNLVLTRTAAKLEQRIWSAADSVLVVSELLQRDAVTLGVDPRRVHIVRTGVDTELFSPDTSGEPIRERHGLRGKTVIGFIGSLKPWHDLDTLLAATRHLVDGDASYHLLIVGKGPRLDELIVKNESFVMSVGAVEHDEIPAYLAAMDVVAVPYAGDQEHYFSPIKLFESMAMARPVVGANIGQVAGVIKGGTNGLLYEPGDAANLASAIKHIVSLPDRGASLGQAARADVEAKYTWRHVADQIIAAAESSMTRAPA
jgi:glycosyltransferase involved in cell wall biosynthesis